MTFLEWLQSSRKAIVAGVGAGLAALAGALAVLPPGASLKDITLLGWIGIAQAVLGVAAGGTYLMSNRVRTPAAPADKLAPAIVEAPVMPAAVTQLVDSH